MRCDAGAHDRHGTSSTGEDERHHHGPSANSGTLPVESDAHANDLDAEPDDLDELVTVGPPEKKACDETEDAEREGESVVVVDPFGRGPRLGDEDVGGPVE